MSTQSSDRRSVRVRSGLKAGGMSPQHNPVRVPARDEAGDSTLRIRTRIRAGGGPPGMNGFNHNGVRILPHC